MEGLDFPDHYIERLRRFRYGAGAFKIDYALSCAIPWTAKECFRAGTVHIGGSFEEIVEAERTLTSKRPFVLLGQPTLFDPHRAPAGQHIAWAYCHIPNGSRDDYIAGIEDQITRFAPGFRDCVLARSVSTPATLERWNPNLTAAIFLVAPWIFDSSSFVPPHRCIVLRKEDCICAEHLPRLEVECTGWPDIMRQKLLWRT